MSPSPNDPTARALTRSQERVRAFIQEFCERHGFPPTQAEIAEGLGFRSVNAAAEHVRLLAKKGVLTITPRSARGIRLAETADDSTAPVERLEATLSTRMTLPLIGRVAAGRPILAEENIESTIDVEPELFSPRADYLLRVRGDSMIDAGILNGDLVAVHKVPEAYVGQIAVVRIEDEVTVKRWRRRGHDVVLEAANPAFPPIIVNPETTTVAVEGLVVGLMRCRF